MMRLRLFGAALAAGILLCNTSAPASVNFSTGIRYVMPTGALADCSAKAKTALGTYLENPTEQTPGSGDWSAFGPLGASGPTTYSAAATVRCFSLDQGFVVTFTCMVEQPQSAYTANALCLDIAHNFSGKVETPLATPAPIIGCSPTDLSGKWVSDDSSGPTLTLTPDGNLLDGDGVSGNWVIYNGAVTLTYYGNHNLKLSADNKHIRGDGYSLSRKC